MPDEEWLRTCTCPGNGLHREVELRVKQEIEQHEAQAAEVFHNLDVGRGRSAGEIQQQIRASYAAHGYEPPSDYSRLSRFIAAGTGRRGTRTIRLLLEAVRGLGAASKWTPPDPHEADDARRRSRRNPDKSEEYESEGYMAAQNKRELGRAFCGLAVFAILAAAAAVGASFASGVFQVILIVLAILLFAIIVWGGVWTIVAVILRKIDRRWSSHR